MTNGPMSLAAAGMATCVKPTPLQSSAAATGFVKVEGGSAYYGGSYGLAAPPGEGSGGGGASHSSASSFCLSSLPFSHESYQLAAASGHTQTATGPLLAAAVDTNIRSFSAPTSAATIPYIACDQCSPSSTSAVQHHPTVLYNWAGHHQSAVPMCPTSMLNHAGFGASSSGLMGAHTPSSPPPQPSRCAPVASPDNNTAPTPASDNSLQPQVQENTSSPHESGYSSATSPALTHHRYEVS